MRRGPAHVQGFYARENAPDYRPNEDDAPLLAMSGKEMERTHALSFAGESVLVAS